MPHHGGVRGLLNEHMTEEIFQFRVGLVELDEADAFQYVELSLNGVDGHDPLTTSAKTVAGNCRPITDATRSVRRISGGSRSIRARSSPWIVSGMSTSDTSWVATHRSPSRRMTPRSMSIPMTSSTNSGLPSDRARMYSRVADGNDSITSRLPTNVRLWSLGSPARRSSTRPSPNSSRVAPMSRQPGTSRSGRDNSI